MDILKIAIDWAKAEIISSTFFVVFGILFIVLGVGFWQGGKTYLSKAYIIPALVAGSLLVVIGLGLIFSNKSRVSNFPTDYENNAVEFVQSEITRTEKTLDEYGVVVFKIIPLVMIICLVLIMFIDKPLWRASLITVIAMLTVVLLIDSNASARLQGYQEKLLLLQGSL